MRILFIEDNADLREGIAEIMAGPDRSIVSCADAEEGLARFAADHFDVVMTDVSLPGMSGTELARVILATHPQQRIVLCTGYDFGQHARSLGPKVRTLVKPFELEALEAMLGELALDIRNAAGAAD